MSLHVVDHPLLADILARLRDRTTPCEEFRALAYRISVLLVAEATGDLPTAEVAIETPLESTTGRRLAARVVAPGGLLLACCNVAELPWRAFRDRVVAGLAEAGRTAEIVGVYHEPAIDHPSPWGGEPYLKMLAVRLN